MADQLLHEEILGYAEALKAMGADVIIGPDDSWPGLRDWARRAEELAISLALAQEEAAYETKRGQKLATAVATGESIERSDLLRLYPFLMWRLRQQTAQEAANDQAEEATNDSNESDA